MPPPSKTVAIVVPLSNRPGLDADEEISLRHLLHYLGKYDKFMIAPRNLEVDYPGFQVRAVRRPLFWKRYCTRPAAVQSGILRGFHTIINIFLFTTSTLLFFRINCLSGASGISISSAHRGFRAKTHPWVREPHVGNSGFALLKVRSFLRVLYSRRRAVEPAEVWNEIQPSWPPLKRLRGVLRTFRRQFLFRNHVRHEIEVWLERGWALTFSGLGSKALLSGVPHRERARGAWLLLSRSIRAHVTGAITTQFPSDVMLGENGIGSFGNRIY